MRGLVKITIQGKQNPKGVNFKIDFVYEKLKEKLF